MGEIAERAISWYKAHKDKNERLGLAWTFYHADRWEASLTLYEESHKESPDSVDYIGSLGPCGFFVKHLAKEYHILGFILI